MVRDDDRNLANAYRASRSPSVLMKLFETVWSLLVARAQSLAPAGYSGHDIVDDVFLEFMERPERLAGVAEGVISSRALFECYTRRRCIDLSRAARVGTFTDHQVYCEDIARARARGSCLDMDEYFMNRLNQRLADLRQAELSALLRATMMVAEVLKMSRILILMAEDPQELEARQRRFFEEEGLDEDELGMTLFELPGRGRVTVEEALFEHARPAALTGRHVTMGCVADVHGVSRGTIYRRCNRVRKALREQFPDHNIWTDLEGEAT